VTFDEWYLALSTRLQGYAVQKFGIPADEAEEIVHDVFLSFFAPRKPIRSERSWFFGAVSHACRDYLRKHGRIVSDENLPMSSFEPPYVARVTAREMLRAIDPIHAELLVMQFVNGYTVKEIAAQFRRSVSWTEKRLRRARREAAAVLGDDDETHRRPVGRRVRKADTFGSAVARAPKLRMICGHVCFLRGTSLPRTHPRPAVLSAHRRAARQVRGELSDAHGLLQNAAGGA
jgi:DNA-directed RNA polymerase specialized sigma24 family protein